MIVVNNNFMYSCIFGIVPSKLVPTPAKILSQLPVHKMTDINSLPFGVCMSPVNPANIPIPIFPPCTPVLSPWTNPSKKIIMGGIPIITASSIATCMIGKGILLPIPSQPKIISQ